MERKIKILWKDLQIGDIFPDGSEVTDITEWDYRKCYKLYYGEETLVCSDTHLILCEVYNKQGNQINETLKMSKKIRTEIGEIDSLWICAEDLYQSINRGHEVNIITGVDIGPLDKIEKFGEDKMKVRCISTSKGYYTIGPFISHNTGTMSSIEQQGSAGIIMATLDGWGSSPIIQKMREAETTEQMRNILYEGLKEQYEESNIKQDDFNLQMIAKKMTSYKRTPEGLQPIEEGEKADIVSIGALGNANNIFKSVELSSGYKTLTRPLKQKLRTDAGNQIIN